jgi:uncharacterized membrane protein YqaE (UPF0057 family)
MTIACMDCCKIVFAVILPPVAVMLERKACDAVWCISLILTLLFFLPGYRSHQSYFVGILFAFFVILGGLDGHDELGRKRIREEGNRTDIEQPTEPTQPTEPIHPTEPTEPVQPKQLTELTESTKLQSTEQLIEPVQPTDPTHPTELTESRSPL